MRDKTHSSSHAHPRGSTGVMSRAAMTLMVLLLGLATPTSAHELQHLEETLQSHSHTLAKMTKYLRMTDKFWNWFHVNRVPLDELLSAGVQTRSLNIPQLDELNEKIMDVETKLEGVGEVRRTEIDLLWESVRSQGEVTKQLKQDLEHLEEELEAERNSGRVLKQDLEHLEEELEAERNNSRVLKQDLEHLEEELEAERNSSRVLKQELDESKQKTQELEQKLSEMDQSVKRTIFFVNSQILKVNNGLGAMKTEVQQLKDMQGEIRETRNKVEDHEHRISRMEAEGNVTKSGWAGAILRQVENEVAPLRLALDRLNDTITNDTAKKVEDHERRISHWEAEGNVTKSGWAGAILRQVENEVAPLRLALNDTASALRNETAKAKKDIEEMKEASVLDREYIKSLEMALDETSFEVNKLGSKLDQLVSNFLFPMNGNLTNNTGRLQDLQDALQDIQDEFTLRFEEVERDIQRKGSTGSTKSSMFQWQLNTIRNTTKGMALNISALVNELRSVRDSGAQLKGDVQVLQQQSGQLSLDLRTLATQVGKGANLTSRVKDLETRMARKDAAFTTGNRIFSSLAGGGSMMNTPGGKAPVNFLKNPSQIGFPMLSPAPSGPTGVAPSAVVPPAVGTSGVNSLSVAPSAVAPSAVAPSAVAPSAVAPPAVAPSAVAPSVSTGTAGSTARPAASANSVLSGNYASSVPPNNSGPSGGQGSANMSGPTASPGLVGSMGVSAKPGAASTPTGNLGIAGSTSVTRTPGAAGNAGAAGNTSVTSTPGTVSNTAGNTSVAGRPGPAGNFGPTGKPGTSANLGTTGNPRVTSNPGAAINTGAAGNSVTTGGTRAAAAGGP